MNGDPTAWALSIAAIAISASLAWAGWKRDAHARTEDLKSKYVSSLIDFIQAQTAPLLDESWAPNKAMDATVHHAKAVGIMNAIGEHVRDPDLTRWVADQGHALGSEARKYRTSSEAKRDSANNTFGVRRAALLSVSARLKQELLQWQRGDLTRINFATFTHHYCLALLEAYGDERNHLPADVQLVDPIYLQLGLTFTTLDLYRAREAPQSAPRNVRW